MTWHEAQYAVAHEPMEPPRSVLRIETADRAEVAAWLRDMAERLAPTPAGPRADQPKLVARLAQAVREIARLNAEVDAQRDRYELQLNDRDERLAAVQAAYLQVREELDATRAAVNAADAEVKRLKAQLDDERERQAADFLKSINTLTIQLHDARRERDELRAATTEVAEARPEVDAVLVDVERYGNERFAGGLAAGRGSMPGQKHAEADASRLFRAIKTAVHELAAEAGPLRKERDAARWAAEQNTAARPLSATQSAEQTPGGAPGDPPEFQAGAEAILRVVEAAREWLASIRRTLPGGPVAPGAVQLAEAVDALSGGVGRISWTTIMDTYRNEIAALQADVAEATANRALTYATARLRQIGTFLRDDADVFVADPADPIDGVRELARRMATAEALRKADMRTLERWAPVIDAAHRYRAAFGTPPSGTVGFARPPEIVDLLRAVDSLDDASGD